MLNRYAKNVDNYTEGERYALLKKIVRRANKGGNITVQSYGVENIPNENGFMFYPNHQGLYDVLAIVDACPTPFSVVAKKEVGNVPFLRQVFACICFDILFDPFSPREKSCHYRRQYFLLWRVVPGLAAIPAGFDRMCHCSLSLIHI